MAKEAAISERHGAAWRNQGLDYLSAASYQARRQANPRQGVFCAWGSPFFADFLWRGKESQRGALPLSATASKEASRAEPAPTVKQSFNSCFQVLLGTCSLARVFRAFQRMMLANPRKQGVPGHPTRKRPIYKGYRGACLEIPYLRGFPGMPFRLFDHYEVPYTPLGAAAGAG